MKLSLSNLSKPSNKRYKSIADFFLFTMPLYLGAILALPISEDLKIWLNFGVTMIIISLKGLTKLTTDENIYSDPEKTFKDE